MKPEKTFWRLTRMHRLSAGERREVALEMYPKRQTVRLPLLSLGIPSYDGEPVEAVNAKTPAKRTSNVRRKLSEIAEMTSDPVHMSDLHSSIGPTRRGNRQLSPIVESPAEPRPRPPSVLKPLPLPVPKTSASNKKTVTKKAGELYCYLFLLH